jgi:hypothetical protein
MKIISTLLLSLFLVACSEKVQNLGSRKNVDLPSYMGAKNDYVEKNWTPGDKTSWEAQLKSRAKGQDEYTRVE